MFTADSTACVSCLADGGVGAMCPVTVLLPRATLEVVRQYHAGNDALAATAQARVSTAAGLLRSESVESDSSVASVLHWGVKEMLHAAGIIESAAVRSPEAGLSGTHRERLRKAMRAIVEV